MLTSHGAWCSFPFDNKQFICFAWRFFPLDGLMCVWVFIFVFLLYCWISNHYLEHCPPCFTTPFLQIISDIVSLKILLLLLLQLFMLLQLCLQDYSDIPKMLLAHKYLILLHVTKWNVLHHWHVCRSRFLVNQELFLSILIEPSSCIDVC